MCGPSADRAADFRASVIYPDICLGAMKPTNRFEGCKGRGGPVSSALVRRVIGSIRAPRMRAFGSRVSTFLARTRNDIGIV